MQFKSSFVAIALSLMAVAEGATIASRAALDIFDPRIIDPNADTVWVIGNVETVTWDTSNAPVNISNRASVVLDRVITLAEDFDLRAGSVDVTVPLTVVPGLHTITLFGDSGDVSPQFKIVASSG